MTTTSHSSGRSGGTLVEVLITVVVLGILASVTTLSLRRFTAPSPDDPGTIVAAILDSVLASGSPRTIQLIVDGMPALVTVNPDGSVLADSLLPFERLTGRDTRVH